MHKHMEDLKEPLLRENNFLQLGNRSKVCYQQHFNKGMY